MTDNQSKILKEYLIWICVVFFVIAIFSFFLHTVNKSYHRETTDFLKKKYPLCKVMDFPFYADESLFVFCPDGKNIKVNLDMRGKYVFEEDCKYFCENLNPFNKNNPHQKRERFDKAVKELENLSDLNEKK